MDVGEHPVRAAFPELSPEETAVLERGLIERAFPRKAARISSVLRSPLASTWYRTEVLELRADTGERAKVFLKDFGSFTRTKGRMEERRERERYVYKDLFPDGSLGLPRYVAELWDRDRTWLFLEYVEGVPLGWCDLARWFEAAAWLGRFQSAAAALMPRLEVSERFTRHGRAYFEGIATRALKSAADFGPELAPLVERAIPAYLEQTEDLKRAPQTLVHGAFRPAQVLVQETVDPPRICPVDWEVSALGSYLYDLAVLADGFEDAELQTFLDRFLTASTWLQEERPSLSDLRDAVRVCRTHRTMKWIGHAEARDMGEEDVQALVASLSEAETPLP